MNKKDREKFKKLLLEDKKRIVRHLDELSEDSDQQLGSGTSTAGDPADIASAEISQASLQKIGKRETYLLRKIDYALGKIEDGAYGDCEMCGEEIGVKRLMARPVAQLCIDCKTEQENAEKRFSSWDSGSGDNYDFDEDEEG